MEGMLAAPVFKTIADYVYATDLLLQDEKKLADQSIPQSKDGFQADLQFVFEELEVPPQKAKSMLNGL